MSDVNVAPSYWRDRCGIELYRADKVSYHLVPEIGRPIPVAPFKNKFLQDGSLRNIPRSWVFQATRGELVKDLSTTIKAAKK